MRPVFANSAFVHARAGLLQRGAPAPWQNLTLQVRYGLFHHPLAGAVLIDTGYTSAVTADPGRSLALRAYARVLAPQLRAEGQVLAFLARQGLTAQEITTVIVTHYHADHIAGLKLFPQARIIAPGAELQHIRGAGPLQRLRHGVFAELLPDDLETRLTPVESLPRRRAGPDALPGLRVTGRDLLGDGSLLAVALPGHAAGQFGLWFAAEGLLYAVDTEWLISALDPARPPGIGARLVSHNRQAGADSRRFVHELAARGAGVVLCHDPDPTPWDEGQGSPGTVDAAPSPPPKDPP